MATKAEEQVEENGSESEQPREEQASLSTSPASSTFLFLEIVLMVGLAGFEPAITWVLERFVSQAT